MCIRDRSLTLIILCTAPIIIAFAVFFSHMIHKYTELENTETGKAAQLANWAMDSIQLVKLYCTQFREVRNFRELTSNCNDLFIKCCLYVSANTALLRFLSLSMFIQGFWFGATMVRKGKLQISNVVTCFQSCLMLGSTLSNTLQVIVILQKGDVALKKILGFLSTSVDHGADEPIYEPETPAELCTIAFNNITFSYPSRPSHPVLKNVSLCFEPTKFTFIIGKSGSGKSTLSNLLLKFYDDYNGTITVKGNDVKEINRNWLLNNVTVVEQRCTLFNDTLRNNILLGVSKDQLEDHESIEQKLKDACSISMLDRLVCDLPHGLNTIIGSGGISLSGGQQQRVAIARAFMRNKPILILDEAVSALDIIHRELLMKNIRQWRSGKTTILLTHELSQIEPDDYTYVIQEGEVKENGYQKDLKQKKTSVFNHMLNLQTNNRDSYAISDRTALETPIKENNIFADTTIDSDSESPISKEADLSYMYEEASYRGLSGKAPSIKDEIYINEKASSTETDLEKGPDDKKGEFKLMPLGEVMMRMLRTIRQRNLLFFGIFWALIAGAANPIFSFCFSYLLNGIVPSVEGVYKSERYLLKWSFIVLGVAVADGVSNFLKAYILGYCSENWIMDLRNEAMESILNKDLFWFSKDTNKSSELSALLLNDLRDLRSLVSEFLSAMTTFMVVSLIGLIWALVSGWKLSLVCLSMFPLIIAFSAVYGTMLQKYETTYKTSVAALENQEYEIMTGIKTIRSLQAESHFIKNYSGLEHNMRAIAHKRSIATGFGISVTNMITICIQSILYYYGIKLVFEGEYSSKKMFETFTLLLFTIMTCTSLVNQIPDISRGQRSATFLYRILDEGLSLIHI